MPSQIHINLEGTSHFSSCRKNQFNNTALSASVYLLTRNWTDQKEYLEYVSEVHVIHLVSVKVDMHNLNFLMYPSLLKTTESEL